jgi:hypothetical protein
MSSPRWIVAALCAVSCHAPPAAAPSTASAPTTAPADEAAVRARERAWLDAYEQRDPVAMADVLAEGFLITFQDGHRRTKAETVESVRRPRASSNSSRFTTRGTVALARDGVIILVGDVIETRTEPQGERRDVVSTYTDTWIREGATWRVLASHLSRAPTPAAAAAAPAPVQKYIRQLLQ